MTTMAAYDGRVLYIPWSKLGDTSEPYNSNLSVNNYSLPYLDNTGTKLTNYVTKRPHGGYSISNTMGYTIYCVL